MLRPAAAIYIYNSETNRQKNKTHLCVNMITSLVVFTCVVAASLALPQAQVAPKECPAHEVLNECANALCDAQECIHIDKSVPCPGVSQCVAECICEAGYLRAANGTCIPREQCDPQPCPHDFEYYVPSKSSCAKETCESLSPDYVCEEGPPQPGCVCIKDYVRKDAHSPCDTYVCDCPQMANVSWCAPVPSTST